MFYDSAGAAYPASQVEAAIKSAEGRSQPISLPLRTQDIGADGLPAGLPGSTEIRLLADYLEYLCPVNSALTLVQARDYTAAHELSGFHEAICALRDIADNVDEANNAAAQAAQGGGL